MHARSALFDLYGDHLRARGDRAPVAALVRLLAPLGIAAPAVRTAISRMVRQGWLRPVRLPAGRGYALTERARHRLDDAAARIYRTRDATWDGQLGPAGAGAARASRSARERVRSRPVVPRLRAALGQHLDQPVRLPRGRPAARRRRRAGFARFRAHDDDPAERARDAWDLDGLAAAYVAWRGFADRLLDDPASELAGIATPRPDERAFAVRSVLVHEWRKFLFTDPGTARRAAAAPTGPGTRRLVLRRGGRAAAAGRRPASSTPA